MLCAVAHGLVHDHLGAGVFDANGGLLCCAGLALSAWCHLHGNESCTIGSCRDGLSIQAHLAAALIDEPAREAFEFYPMLGYPVFASMVIAFYHQRPDSARG